MRAFRFVVAIVAAVALAPISGGAMADAIKQIQLNEKQIENFIAVQRDLAAILQKVQGIQSDKPDPKIQAEIEVAVKKSGFAGLDEYGAVAQNISLLMSCIDPKTKAFSEPKVAIQRQINELKADKSVPEPQKKQILEDLNEALATVEPVKFPSNIELVKKYYEKIDSAS